MCRKTFTERVKKTEINGKRNRTESEIETFLFETFPLE